MKDYKNILIIKLGALGDWIHMTGFYATIRKKWPRAHITILTTPPFIKLAQECPSFDDYLIDNRSQSLSEWLRITKTILADGNYDLILDMQCQKRTQKRYYSLARFFTKQKFTWATLRSDDSGFNARETPKKWRFTWGKEKKFFIPMDFEEASLSFCKADPKIIKLLPKKYVLLIPGCSPTHMYKRWPADNYRALALRLAKDNIHTVVLGTNTEHAEIESICRENPKAINFCNKSSLFDIPEIATKAMAVVGNDTGPQHMSELGETPAITLFSQITQRSHVTRENVTNLVGKEISDISVDDVYNTLQSLWHKA